MANLAGCNHFVLGGRRNLAADRHRVGGTAFGVSIGSVFYPDGCDCFWDSDWCFFGRARTFTTGAISTAHGCLNGANVALYVGRQEYLGCIYPADSDRRLVGVFCCTYERPLTAPWPCLAIGRSLDCCSKL